MGNYIETTNELVKGLNSIFKGLTLWKFLKWIITIAIVIGIGLFIFESFFSSSFYYDKLDRKLIVIEKIKSINSKDSAISNAVNEQLLKTLNQLDQPEPEYFKTLENLKIPGGITNAIIKFTGAILLPLLIIFASRKDPDNSNTITGAVMFIIIFGIVALFIPIIYSVWLHFLIMPLIELLVLVPFMLKNK